MIYLARRSVIPPNSVCYLKGRMTNPQDHVSLIEPILTNPKVLIPKVLVHGAETVTMSVTNCSDQYVTLKRNVLLGSAMPVELIQKPESEAVDNSLEPEEVVVRQSTLAEDSNKLPAFLQPLYERNTSNLTTSECATLKALLCEFTDIFASNDFDIGLFRSIQHKIDTGKNLPTKQRIRRTPLGFEKEEEKHLKKMLDSGVIQPSSSEWASAPVLIRKKDGTVRYCIDYRDLNSKTVKDAFPLPLIDQCLDALQGVSFFSTLDLAAGYWQISIDPQDRHKTAFITKYGLYEHVRMGLGLFNAPATFQRVMNLFLRGLSWNETLAYLDDVMILRKDFEDSIQNLRKVFIRFHQYNLKLKPKKCELLRHDVDFLGRHISSDGMTITHDKVVKTLEWGELTCKKRC